LLLFISFKELFIENQSNANIHAYINIAENDFNEEFRVKFERQLETIFSNF